MRQQARKQQEWQREVLEFPKIPAKVIKLPSVRHRTGLRHIEQKHLARILSLEAEIRYLQHKHDVMWSALREALSAGAPIEKGPLRAWFKFVMRMTPHGRRVITRMEVR